MNKKMILVFIYKPQLDEERMILFPDFLVLQKTKQFYFHIQIYPVADPKKLDFFASEEFLRFSLLS